MNLAIDIGNSGKKLAVFDGEKKIIVFRDRNSSEEELRNNLSSYKIKKVIISSVKEIPESVNNLCREFTRVHILSSQSKLPFTNSYETPGTLGPDRMAAVAGACRLFPSANCLLIDAGTAITYEFISGNEYLGGNISPGLKMRFSALNRFTGKLPLVEPVEHYSFPGKNTPDAISAGVISGMIYEINEYIRTFEKKYAGAKVVMTGGDGDFLKKKLNERLLYQPDLVVEGLNYILEYNAK
jgi:type III pantothenate kinase